MNKSTIYILATFICVMMATATYAQDSTKLTLQTAIDNAIKHRNEIKIQKVNAEYSQNEVKKKWLQTIAAADRRC